MPRATTSPKPTAPAKKDSGDASKKPAPDRKKPMTKRRGGGRAGGGGGPVDDDSVDSRGNLRDFISYSDEEDMSSSEESFQTEEETSSGELTPEQRQAIRRSARKAAVKAREVIRKKLAKSASSESLATTASGMSATAATEEEVTEKPKLRIRPVAASSGKARLRKGGAIESDSESDCEEEEEVVRPRGGFQPRRRRARAPSPVEEETEDEESSESSSSSSEEEERPRRRRHARRERPSSRRRRYEESEAEEDTEEEYDSDDDEDYDEEEGAGGPTGIVISIGGGGDEMDERMIPKRHNMKKESAEVKKFVKLVTEPHEEGGIDDQIDEFKALSKEKQAELLSVLDRKPSGSGSTKQSMMFRILTMKVPAETQAMVLAKYNALQSMDPGAGEYYKQRAWLEKLTSLPLGVYREIPARIEDGAATCGAFMERARKCLAEAIYGQEEAKIQVLQFIASKIANPSARGLSLLLSGPPGIGKTSLIKGGIAKALDWPFQFISLGGDSDSSTYVGHQVVYEGSHCGKIANSLVAAKSMSMILMFDELDKISNTPKGEEVQNLLVHLTDPVQNGDFEDKYLSGIPLDLSKVLFAFSANDLGKIDRVLMDRMVTIRLKGYSEKEKLAIAGNFLLPAALRDVKLDEKVAIGPDVLEHILKEYAREEEGVRELKRCIEAVVQKINMLRIFNTKDLPFHIPDFQLPFVVKKAHVDLFLKKKESSIDPSIAHLYI
jgi:DNA polymerase III delta prime subunit